MNLLMVNDEILTVETMKTDIPWKQYGIEEVWTAYDAGRAKECFSRQKIDIMLCDIEMPGQNGIELLRWVRGNQRHVECIFLTCHANFEYAKEAISLGCRDYLLIPARYEDIGAAVLKVVNRIQEERQAKKYQEYGQQIMEVKEQAIEMHGQKKSTQELAEKAEEYIHQNIGSESLSVNEVAEELFLHPVYLNRIFRKERGISIGQFIVSERMKLAAELLQTRRLSANVVAEQVGYRRYKSFALTFRRYYDCSPSQFLDLDEK